MRNGAGYKLIAKGEKINRTKRCTTALVGKLESMDIMDKKIK
jgi:hypothetical protein